MVMDKYQDVLAEIAKEGLSKVLIPYIKSGTSTEKLDLEKIKTSLQMVKEYHKYLGTKGAHAATLLVAAKFLAEDRDELKAMITENFPLLLKNGVRNNDAEK